MVSWARGERPTDRWVRPTGMTPSWRIPTCTRRPNLLLASRIMAAGSPQAALADAFAESSAQTRSRRSSRSRMTSRLKPWRPPRSSSSAR